MPGLPPKRKKNRPPSRERKLRDALVRSKIALDAWLNTYAHEFCNKDDVAKAGKLIMDSGGTLAYIADVQRQNREALNETAPTNGERMAQGR
ncbi:hypothetical protein LCGC14_1118990 [marine sediment metagenome]|uniref:Uncharacterized protein n=1 Tax=marine sediment metagenome TaxID=412755 RepID=A0A0F9M4J6_9ZZZZ